MIVVAPPEVALKLLELSGSKEPLPPEVLELKARIEAAIALAEMWQKMGVPYHWTVRHIVIMKLELDELYVNWGKRTLH
jgi:hypothetical protein